MLKIELWWACVALGLVACADAVPPATPAPKPAPVAAAPAAPEGSIDRRELETVLRAGPPWVLQRVPIEEVMEKDKFVGWRVTGIPAEWNVDLQPGDVVTAVNAMPIETPTDFWAAWTTLTVASELKLAYLRDGEPREVSIPIHGAPNPDITSDLQQRPDQRGDVPAESPVRANQRYNKPKQDKTIVIQGERGYDTDTMVDWSN